jgi:transcriptional regulator with XRE-family HTH domain
MTKRTLGAVVKEARDEARMTQRDLAAAIGVKASHIAYIENGHRKPSISLLTQLRETLGLDGKEILMLAHPEAVGRTLVQPSRFGGYLKAEEHTFVTDEDVLRPYECAHLVLRITAEAANHVLGPGLYCIVHHMRLSFVPIQSGVERITLSPLSCGHHQTPAHQGDCSGVAELHSSVVMPAPQECKASPKMVWVSLNPPTLPILDRTHAGNIACPIRPCGKAPCIPR